MAQPIYRILGTDRQESGQVSADFVRQWIAQGLANAETPLRTEEVATWKPLGQFPEFAEDLEAAGAKPLPDYTAAVLDKAPASLSCFLGVSSLLLGMMGSVFGFISVLVGLLFVCAGVAMGIPAVVTGSKAGKQIRENPTHFGGKRLAIAGLVLGCLSLLLTVAWGKTLFTTAGNVRERERSRICVSNLKQVNLGARLYAKYNDRVLPPDLLTISNELGSPLVVHCPADTQRPVAKTWAGFRPENASYEYLKPAAPEADALRQVVFRCPVHGHLCYGDGKVLEAGNKWAPVLESVLNASPPGRSGLRPSRPPAQTANPMRSRRPRRHASVLPGVQKPRQRTADGPSSAAAQVQAVLRGFTRE